MSDGRIFFTLHGRLVLVVDSEDEDVFLRHLEVEVEAEYDSEGEGFVEEDIGEGLDPNEDSLDDLVNVREESDDENPDEDLIQEEEHLVVESADDEVEDPEDDPIEEDEPLAVEPEEEGMGPAEDPIADEDNEFIDWDVKLQHIDDGPPEDWEKED